MKTLIFSLILCSASAAISSEAPILIDFGPQTTNSTNGTGPTTDLPQTWNNFGTTTTNVALKDSNGDDTNYALSRTGANFSALGEAASPLSSPWPTIASGDALYTSSPRTLTLSGLSSSLFYHITVYGFVSRATSRNTAVTIGGVEQYYEASNLRQGGTDAAPVDPVNPNGGSVTFLNLSPNEAGEIHIDFSVGPGNTAGGGNFILGVMEVTSGTTVLSAITPENSYLSPGENFEFGVTSHVDLDPGDISLVLNGADATSQLTVGGTPTERIVTINGLAPGNDYTATVTVNGPGGALVRTFSFTTREPAPQITDVTRDGSYLYPAAHFQLAVQSHSPALTLDPANITLTLNGVDAPGQLSIGGTPQDRALSITGLIPHQSYQATVTASSAHGNSVARTYHFHTLGTPLALFDTGGFSDNEIYPTGDFQPTIHGYSRWQPYVGTNQAQIINTGEPGYDKVLRRTQGSATRVDSLYFPPLADGVLKVAFDARVSEAGHRTLDVALMPDSTTLMAGFLQFGHTSHKISYFDNTNYYVLDGFNLDTEWHRYELIHYFSGPHERTYDLYIDGILIGSKLPWRSDFTGPLIRMRIQTMATPSGASPGMADIDNIVITAQPLEVEPIAPPVTTTQLGQGVVYKKFTYSGLFGSKQNVFVAEINLNDPSTGLAFPHNGADDILRTVPYFAGTVPGAVAAVNAQFFSFETNKSIQYLKVNDTVVNLTTNMEVPQAIVDDGLGTPNSVRIARRPSAGWEGVPIPNIMASGPWLSREGLQQNFVHDPADTFTHGRHPRTAAAWTYDNRLLLVAVDGRTTASAGMTIPELQTYIHTLGWIKHAVNYDGGGSTTLWTSSGGVMNVPSGGILRPVANAIAVTAAPVAIPATPASVVAAQGDGHISLHWQLSSGATGYEVRRATSAEGPYEVIGTSPNTWFTDTTAVTGTDYFYVIAAINSLGQSLGTPPLATGPVDGAPLVPTVAISTVSGIVNLTFNTESGRTYQLQHSTDLLSTGWKEVGAPISGTGSPVTLQHTATGTVAFYRILIE